MNLILGNSRPDRDTLAYCTILALLFVVGGHIDFHHLSSVALRIAIPTIPATSEATAQPDFAQDDDLIAQLHALLLPDKACTLPCFLGFQPGKSTLSDIQTAVANFPLKKHFDTIPLYTDSDGLTIYDAGLRLTEAGGFTVKFASQENLLIYTKIEAYRPDKWLLDSPINLSVLLRMLGAPTDKLVKIQYDEPTTALWTLIYEKQGVLTNGAR